MMKKKQILAAIAVSSILAGMTCAGAYAKTIGVELPDGKVVYYHQEDGEEDSGWEVLEVTDEVTEYAVEDAGENGILTVESDDTVKMESSQDAAEGSCEMVVESTSEGQLYFAVEEKEQQEKKEKEYKTLGIGTDKNGSWSWEGKPVYFLMDDDGSFFTNSLGKEDKIYLHVVRDDAGNPEQAEVVTAKEFMERQVEQDLKEENK